MRALLVYRADESQDKLRQFDEIAERLAGDAVWVERYDGISRLCPIPLDVTQAYLTDCEGNYLKLAARIKARCPDCKIYDVSHGGQEFITDWTQVDPNVQKPEAKAIHVEGEPHFEHKDGQPHAVIVKFPSEPEWKELLWNGIHEGLHNSGWNVTVIRQNHAKVVEQPIRCDMLFQWAAKQAQVENTRRFQGVNTSVLNVCVEHGYWARRENCVLMPNYKRTCLNGSADASVFKIQGRKKREYYVIPMQVHGDEQIKTLEDVKPIWQWVTEAYNALKACTDVPVKVRPHPVRKQEAFNTQVPPEDILGLGNGDRWEENTLDRDLRSAYAVVSWNSTFIADAMLHDVPVIQLGDRDETWDYTLHEINKEVCKDIEERGKQSRNLLTGYKKIVPQLAGQQKNYDALKAMDWNGFYAEHRGKG